MNRGAFYGVIFSVLWYRMKLPLWMIALILLGLYAVLGGYPFLRVFCLTIKRDVLGLTRYLSVLLGVRSYQRRNFTVPMVFEEHVKKNPTKVAFVFEGKEWTFKMVSEFSNQIAHVFEDAGFKPGDSVALVLDNRPEYVAIWIGLAKAGIVTALINHNLKGNPLLHSIQIANSKAVIFGADFTQSMADVREQLGSSVRLFAFDVGQKSAPAWADNLDSALSEASIAPLDGEQRGHYNSNLLYIYTSGTTGLPKAAIIRHSRYLSSFLISFSF